MGIYITVLIFIAFDVLTGLIKALAKEGLNSTVLRKGLFHKLSEIITVFGAALLQHGAEYIKLGVDFPALIGVASYICVMELVSIIENIAIVNPTLGKLFKPFLNKLKDEHNEDNNSSV